MHQCLTLLTMNKHKTSTILIQHVPVIRQRRILLGKELEWKMLGGNQIAIQLDCPTSITSSQNNGIHCIQFSQYITFNMLNHFASTGKCEKINIWGLDWIASKWSYCNQQMPCDSISLNLISCWAMIVGLNIIHISSENYTTGIYSDIYSSV